MTTVTSYKGFDKDMKCRDFQYEEGKEYECEKAEICSEGFHACRMPLDTFKYYNPTESIYHVVEQSGDISERKDENSKVASTKIKIGAKIDVKGLVRAQIDLIFEKIKNAKDKAGTSGNVETSATSGDWSTSATSGDWSTSATSGDWSTSATSGYGSTSATSGTRSTSATSGDWSTSATSGYGSTSATSGDWSTSATSGDWSTSATSGYGSTSATSGTRSTSATSGDWSTSATSGTRSTSATSGYGSTSATSGRESTSATNNKNAIAVACGLNARAKGVNGSYIVVTEWNEEETELLCAKMIKIGGKYKEGVYYTVKDGKVVEHENQSEDWD